MLYHWATSTLYAEELKSRVAEVRKIRIATCVHFPVAILFFPKSSHLMVATLPCLGQSHHSWSILYPSGCTWFEDKNTPELPGFFRLCSSGTSIGYQWGSHNGAQSERLHTWNWTDYILKFHSPFWSQKSWNQEGPFVVVLAVNGQEEESSHCGTSQPLNEVVDSGRALKYVPSWNWTLYLLALWT